MSFFKTSFMILACATLTACMAPQDESTSPTGSSTPTQAAASVADPSRTFLFSWGMFADPVFDRDVETFGRTFAQAYGAPAGRASYGANSPRLDRPDVTAIDQDLRSLAAAATDGQDLLVVMLTSHGSPDAIAVQFDQGGPVAMLSADGLADLLAPLNADRQILILQACFSGSLIDELRHPNRIILTAAAADRSSFGCNPDSDNTWFIKSLNRAIAQGGSWEQIFARTRALVTADETREGVTPSNPQRFVGANMRDVWTENAT